MAQAEDQNTPIKDLDGALRYLTEDLGYRKGFAAYLMNQCYLDGQLQLEKQECVRDGEPYGDAVPIDHEFGYIELDPHGRVRVAPRIKLWREVRYRIAEGCDVRAIWPPRLLASQTAPGQRLEDKAGPDPFRTGVAGRPTAKHLIQAEAERRITEKEVTPTQGGLTAFSENLERWWAGKRLTFNPPGPSMTAGSIKNVVRQLWRAALSVQNPVQNSQNS